jgi:hypothetical protein
MARKAFLLRIDPKVLSAVERWAEEELRSLNGQIEYLLRQALAKRGIRLGAADAKGNDDER